MNAICNRRGFTLVELLVSLAMILLLLGLVSAGIAAARANAKATNTRQLIAKLSQILNEQLATYDSRVVDVSSAPDGMSKDVYRAWSIRRNLISGDLPDRWVNVKYMAENSAQFRTGPQQRYIAIWNSLPADAKDDTKPQFVGKSNDSAECLFMIVTQGGIADCLECGGLKTAQVGDEDRDGMLEFWDDWNNPIGLLLWAPGLELPAGSGTLFFGNTLDEPFPRLPVSNIPRPTLGMRPLIYSPGRDGKSGFFRGPKDSEGKEEATLSQGDDPFVGANCGDWKSENGEIGGRALETRDDPRDPRLDNVTNFDLEAKK